MAVLDTGTTGHTDRRGVLEEMPTQDDHAGRWINSEVCGLDPHDLHVDQQDKVLEGGSSGFHMRLVPSSRCQGTSCSLS